MSSVKRRIRIMHVAQAAGGVERYLRYLLKYLNHDKFENICVCSQDFKEKDYEGIADVFETVEMQRSIGTHDLSAVSSFRKLIKKYKPDIVYAHSSKAGAVVRLANIGINNKCIYNPHGWAFNMRGSKKKLAFYVLIERIMAPFADVIVCISEAERKSAIDKKICSKNKLKVIFNGIDIKGYEDEPHEVISRKQLGIPDDAFVVGMVGRLCVQKAPDVFIQMAKYVKDQIPRAHFIIVGDGYMQEEVEKYAGENGLKNSLHITGWVNNPLGYVEIFDVACLLSRWEGFGLAIPEYMMCGKPIVASEVDAIPNLVVDHRNGLLVPVDEPIAACKAVIELINNDELRESIIDQGKKDAYEKYDARRVSDEHEMLFEKITKE